VSSCRVPVLRLFVVGVTNWSGEGVEPKSLSMGVRLVSPCDGCPPLPFIDVRGRHKKGNKRQVRVFGRWDVLSCVTIRLGALKRSSFMLSWRPPLVRAGLFTLGRLPLLPSSLGLTQTVWAQDELATCLIVGMCSSQGALECLGWSLRAAGSDATAT
jgi:hypothetical protein